MDAISTAVVDESVAQPVLRDMTPQLRSLGLRTYPTETCFSRPNSHRLMSRNWQRV